MGAHMKLQKLVDHLDEDRAEAFCQKLWGQALEDAHAEDEDCVYYTEWC